MKLAHKQLENGCVLNTAATDALVLKHQAISIHSADWIFIGLDQFHTEISHLQGKWTALKGNITFWKKQQQIVQTINKIIDSQEKKIHLTF